MKYEAILFDLDGTLIDSAIDLVNTLNILLAEYNRPSVTIAEVRHLISQGSPKLLEVGFTGDYPMNFDDLRQLYLARYQEKNTETTDFFPGIPALLTAIEESGTPWGIITNKYTAPTEPIVKHLQLDKRTDAIVCGDTLPVAKPDPSPILLACNMIGVNPERCVYIGDAITDVQAGKNAGMITIACAYGYVSDAAAVDSWGADAIATSPKDIFPLII